MTAPAQIIDIAATCYEAAGAAYPREFNGNPTTPIEGESFLPLIEGRQWSREQPIFVEHEGNRGVRVGDWKLVAEYDGPWELYNMVEDRTEQRDQAGREPERVSHMERLYGEWAERCGVLPWPVDPRVVARRLKGKHAHVSQHRAPVSGGTFR